MSVSIWEGEKATRLVSALEAIAIAQSGSIDISDYEQIRQIVRSGNAEKYFNIGDQIITTWSPNASHTYDMPWDIVSFVPVIDKNGETVKNAMWIQSHYALAGIQFDGNEAFYHCDTELTAGTYNISMGNNWGSNVISGKTYQFTLTQNVPAGGQLVLTTDTSTTSGLPDNASNKWCVRSYSTPKSTTEIEKVSLSEGSSGTSLGTLSSSTKYGSTGLNSMQRSAYGYNRWSQSGIRQWLNSNGDINEWWEPQNVYDRPPDQLTSMKGFVAGLPNDFLNIVQPVTVTTALNTVTDTDIGTQENTLDRFFLASLQQEYCAPQLSNVEGVAWDYWKERLGGSNPQAQYSTNPAHIRYSISNHTSSQNVRLRSAIRGFAYNTWNVGTSGNLGSHFATYAYWAVPACVIY